MRFISRTADRPHDRVPLGIGEAETRGRPQLNPARLQLHVRDFGYIKNARIGVAGPVRMRIGSFPDRGGSRPEGVSS